MIAVVGSLNMDLVVSADRIPKPGETLKGNEFAMVPGGKGANQAVGCAKLGEEVTMFGAVGNDLFGDRILLALKGNNIDTRHILIKKNASSGIASIMHTRQDNCITIVSGANGELCSKDMEGLESILPQTKVLLAQLEIPLDVVAYTLAQAKRHGVLTILNPAPALPLPPEIYQWVDYMTPNETEAEILFKRSVDNESELESALRQWENHHPSKVIVTRGEKGCSFMIENGLNTIRPPQVSAIDTTGAGDCFNAALAVGLAKACSLKEAVSFAVNASAESTTKFGALEGMPTIEHLYRKYPICFN